MDEGTTGRVGVRDTRRGARSDLGSGTSAWSPSAADRLSAGHVVLATLVLASAAALMGWSLVT